MKYLKPDSYLPKNIVLFASTEPPLKMMKETFYFILKVFFFFKIFKILSLLLCHVEKTA